MRKILSFVLAIVVFSTMFMCLCATPAVAAQTENASSDINDLQLESTNSLGEMLSENLSENIEDDTGNKVFDIQIKGKTAYVDAQVFVDAILVVAVYDDDGQNMYTSARAQITPDNDYVMLSFDVDAMPDSYLVKAFLLDSKTNKPLSTAFVCNTYTAQMQEFLSKSTEDFEEDRVLNLDEDTDNNFLVYDDGVIVIKSTDDEANIVESADNDNNIYIIKNIDEKIKGLNKGDMFSLEYQDSQGKNLIIGKVFSITIDDTTATIVCEDSDVDDIFEHIKIDFSEGIKEEHLDHSTLSDGVVYQGVDNGEPASDKYIVPVGGDGQVISSKETLSFVLDKNSKDESFSVTGSAKVSFEYEISYYFNSFMNLDEASISISSDIGLEVELEMEIIEIELELSKIAYMPIPGVALTFTPALVFEGSVTATVSCMVHCQIGVEYKDGDFKNTSKAPEFDPQLQVTAEFFLGLSIKPATEIAFGAAEFNIEGKVGGLITLEYTLPLKPQEDEIHECNLCIAGSVVPVISISAEVRFLCFSYEKELGVKLFSPLEFYYSDDHDEFGFGNCPYYLYKQTIRLIEEDKTLVDNAKINDTTTDENGIAQLYFYNGSHVIEIEKEDKKVQKTLVVNGVGEFEIIFRDGLETFLPNNEVVANYDPGIIEYGQCGKNAFYYVYKNGVLKITGDGEMNLKASDIKSNFSKVIIEEGITNINSSAFYYCLKITDIEIPNTVTIIDAEAFQFCDNLKKITIPDSVKTIGRGAFCGCNGLTEITIPGNVSLIGQSAFQGLHNLKNVIVSEGVKRVGNSVFFDCRNLENIYLPKSLTSTGMWAFESCNNIKNVYYGGDYKDWNLIRFDDIGFYSNATIHYNCEENTIPAVNAVSETTKKEIVSIGAKDINSSLETFSKGNLVAGSEAVLIMYEGLPENIDIMDSEILYIDQATVDESGVASFVAYGDFTYDYWVACIYGECNHSGKWATIDEATETESGFEICICDFCGEITDSRIIGGTIDDIVLGDANTDGVVSIKDATAIRKHIVGLITLTDEGKILADVDGSGDVNVKDATAIQKYLAGIDAGFLIEVHVRPQEVTPANN